MTFRVAFVLAWRQEYSLPDQESYLSVASNILSGTGFEVSPEERVGRAPLYPLFLAANFFAFGRSLLWVRLMQAAVGALVCVPVFFLAWRLHGHTAAMVASGICAVYPPYIFYSRLILSEALFIPLLPAIVLACVCLAQEGGCKVAAGLGLALGAAILLRPSSLLLWPTLMALVWLLGKKRLRLAGRLGLASAVVVLCLLPWVTRNYSVTGRVVLTTLTDGWALYEGNSPQATGGPAQHLVVWPREEMRSMDEYERNTFLRRRAMEYIASHPRRFLRLTAGRVARMWSPVPNEPQFRTPFVLACSALSYVAVLIAATLMLFFIRFRADTAGRSTLLIILFWPMVYYGAVHAVTVGSMRYRDPLMYALLVLGAGGVAESCTRWFERRRKSGIGVGAK